MFYEVILFVSSYASEFIDTSNYLFYEVIIDNDSFNNIKILVFVLWSKCLLFFMLVSLLMLRH